VKDKSRSSQSFRAANPLLLAGTIGKREPVPDRRPPPMKAGSSQPGPAAAKTDAGSRDLPGSRRIPLSSPAHAGDPVRRGFSIRSLTSLEYWVTPPPVRNCALGRVTTASIAVEHRQKSPAKAVNPRKNP
jgi:hypothetical protein